MILKSGAWKVWKYFITSLWGTRSTVHVYGRILSAETSRGGVNRPWFEQHSVLQVNRTQTRTFVWGCCAFIYQRISIKFKDIVKNIHRNNIGVKSLKIFNVYGKGPLNLHDRDVTQSCNGLFLAARHKCLLDKYLTLGYLLGSKFAFFFISLTYLFFLDKIITS